jgi:catechol 2,3-dioxygenase-like lactoylglutathione lyase family enzyme
MISGAHLVIYSRDVDADRAFFGDVLGFRSVHAAHQNARLRRGPLQD